MSAERAPRRPPVPPIPVRVAAALAVERTLASRAPAERFLAAGGSRLDERDRRLLAELVYGVLRWLRRLDWVIARAAARSLDAVDAELVAVLRVAALQLLVLERVPAHAAVSEAVDEARRRRGRAAAGFVNAVLRRIAAAPSFDAWPVELDDPVRRLAVESSHPDLLVERWWRFYGSERTRAMVAANNAQRALHLLGFRDRGGRELLAAELAEEGIAVVDSAISPVGAITDDRRALESAAYGAGLFYVQDEASQAAALIPAPVAGERVLDVAAAPGGKGFAILAAEPAARVVFADRSWRRLGTLEENLRRLRRSAPRVVADAEAPPWRDVFDRVVVDAPCTGTGTLRRHPELRWRFGVDELRGLADRALASLIGAASATRRGGLLVLITCSIEPEENEGVVDRFLRSRNDFSRHALAPGELPPADSIDPSAGRWRMLPAEGHDGFTVHVLHRAR